MSWKIRYFESVEVWLDQLDSHRLKAVAKELRLLELCGNNLRLPHSRSLGQGLFELREKRYGLRLYYVFQKNKTICLLHAGGKSAQIKDIVIAKTRQLRLGRGVK
jgi:putative addiction module killer protein